MLYFTQRWQNERTLGVEVVKADISGVGVNRGDCLMFGPSCCDRICSQYPSLRRGAVIVGKDAAINKLSKAGKVGGSGSRRDRGLGRKRRLVKTNNEQMFFEAKTN
jgi:hypothetical protein